MRLKLYIGGRGSLDPFEITIPRREVISPVAIDGEISEDAIVMASLEDISPDAKGTDDYRLQLAYNPCKKFDKISSNASGRCRRFYYESKDENGVKRSVYQDKLFWGAMGPSILRLCKRDEKTGEHEEIWCADVTISPLPDRQRVMLAMVAELLPINPYLALSSAWGLSKLSIRQRWKGESVALDVWSALIEYETTKWLFEKIGPHLYGIIALPAEIVSRRRTLAKVRSLRRLTTMTVRQIGRKMAVRAQTIGDAVVVADGLLSHVDMTAHRVIGDFLQCRLRRLEAIERKFKKLIKEGKKELSDPMSGGDRKGYFKRVVANEGDILKKVSDLRKSIGASYASGPWFGLQHGPSILTVDPVEFEYGASYRYVYAQISSFARMQFVWNSSPDLNSFHKTRHQEVVKGQEAASQNQWVHNYTVVYEGWCFVRLLMALKKFGFDMLDGYRSCVVRNAIDAYMGQRHNTQLQLRSRNNDVVVELCYGCAFPPQTQESTGFCHMKGNTQDPLTPDFSMRIYRADSKEEVYAIVLDSKSGRTLLNFEMKARERYENYIRKNADDAIDQVWLIYAGESEPSERQRHPVSGIEFSHLDGSECWGYSADRYASPVDKNGTFVWSRNGISRHGLQKQFSRRATFVGHVRVNPIAGNAGSVFEEFIEGVLNTAYHVLGLL